MSSGNAATGCVATPLKPGDAVSCNDSVSTACGHLHVRRLTTIHCPATMLDVADSAPLPTMLMARTENR